MSRAPPLAGRPPYATDEPDSVYYDSQQSVQRRARQQAPPDPNDRTSAYNMYDDYLDHSEGHSSHNDSKHAALASATHPQQWYQQSPIPLAAPRPGYAAPIAALNLSQSNPVVTTRAPQLQLSLPSPRFLAPASFLPPSPSIASPHPLQPPITPIKPVFVAPRMRDSIKFAHKPSIMRGNSEETLIPKRGQKGDDFWRRFSMVAKVENSKPQSQKKSQWLKKTQSSTNRLSKWVWCLGIVFLIFIGGASALGWWFTHNSKGHERPHVIGGSQDITIISSATQAFSPTLLSSTTPTVTIKAHGAVVTGSGSGSRKVTPTLTVARRTAGSDPIPTAYPPARSHANRMITH